MVAYSNYIFEILRFRVQLTGGASEVELVLI